VKREEINQIIEKNTLLHPLDFAMLEIREEIMIRIVEGPAMLRLDENRLNLLRMVISLDGKTSAFTLLLQSREGNTVLEIAVIEQLLVLYENCQILCGFLLDGYDAAPERLRAMISKDSLSTIFVVLQEERETAYINFVENNSYRFSIDRLSTFQNLIRCVILALLGEEQYCRFMAEANDAFAVVRSHPKFA
jgi:hypothetical protein